MVVTIKRTYHEQITTGVLKVDEKIICMTLELPNRANQRNISCIPEGLYNVTKQSATQSRPYNFFRIQLVQGRDGILIHKITYVRDLRGCIGVGKIIVELNNGRTKMMTGSGEALTELYKMLPEQFTIKIYS